MSLFEEAGVPLEKAAKDRNLTDFDRKVFESISKALWLPNEFKEYMVQYLALNQPPISISQVIGFSGFSAQFDSEQDSNVETTASTSFTDLATVGPLITGLPDAEYMLIYASVAKNSLLNDAARIAPEVNSTVATIADAAETQLTSYGSIVGFAKKSLANGGNNTVTLKYATSAGTASFYRRRLIALKIANT
jgi:hypothetical protein